jgi:predicted metal-dependent HD superfamily phosphohydrolase
MQREEVWDEAVRVVRGDVHGLVSVRADLLRRWSEPHRGYHDLRHLDEVVAAAAELREDALRSDEEWAEVAFAAWFHDAVYDVTSPAGNERLSADLARAALSANRVEATTVDSVTALVESSADHDVTQSAGPLAVLHDADLWILSAPEDRFDEYCADVRREYASVPDDAYAKGRSAILAPFLDRGWVYRTARARRDWELPARTNLSRELRRLR